MVTQEAIELRGARFPEQREEHPVSYFYTVALDAQDGESLFFSPELLPYIRQLLGMKGSNLIILTEIARKRPHIHVPSGFIISTEAWSESRAIGYDIPDDVWTEVLPQLEDLEYKTGCRFGDPTNPLIVSARSGAYKSMPGMLDTVMNIGINDQTVGGLEGQIGPSAAWESYFKLVADLGKSAFNIDPDRFTNLKQQILKDHDGQRLNQLSPTILKQLVTQAKEIITQEGLEFPENPYDQLHLAISAVFASWDKKKAVDYRNRIGIPHDLGTAVTIQQVVFGNSDKEGAGSGVLETRDSRTLGPAETTFAEREQGTAVVGDAVHSELSIYDLPFPDHIIREIVTMIWSIDTIMGFPQQLEYTFDGEKFWLLQMRQTVLSDLAYFRRLLEISGITRSPKRAPIMIEEAMRLISTAQLQSLLQPGLDSEAIKSAEAAGRLLGRGIPISLGHATAPVITHEEQIRAQPDQESVLVSSLTTEGLTKLTDNIVAYVTKDGSIGSHNASTARLIASERGIPIIFGANTENVQQGQIVTVDGTSGKIFSGAIPVSEDGNSTLTLEEEAIADGWLNAKRANPWLYTYASWYGHSPDLDPALKTIEKAKTRFASRKAHETVAAQAFIPEDIRMGYEVVQPYEEDRIRQRITAILDSGKHATVRTCYKSDRRADAPYRLITNKEALDRFLMDSNSYLAWRDDPDCTELIVGSIPQDKLSKDPDVQKQHCSWTLSVTEGGNIVLQVNPHSPYLRAHEDVGEDSLITFTTRFDKRPDTTTQLPLPAEIRERFADDPGGLAIAEAMYKKIKFLAPIKMTIGEAVRDDVEALKQAQLVADTVFEDWWHKHHLPLRLAAIAEVFPHPDYAPPVLEGQARTGPSGWHPLIYGIKSDQIIPK